MSILDTIEAMESAGVDAAAILATVKKLAERDEQRSAERSALSGSWGSIREQVIERDGLVCSYCRDVTDRPHIDHIIPRSRGGSDRLDNLCVSCPSCNLSKGARLLSELPVGWPLSMGAEA